MASPGEQHWVTAYEQTVGMIKQLIEIRFKLAAFVPVVTGAAIAVIRANDIRPLTQTILAVGGLVVALGIVVYDLRNTEVLRAAAKRQTQLEEKLFSTSSAKSDDTQFLKIPVNHRAGLALVYTATVTAWLWVLLDALATRVDTPDWRWDWQPGRWLQDEAHASLVAAALSVIAAIVFLWAHYKHGASENVEPNAEDAPGA